MRIGELANSLRINPKTIRYYEEIGLLPLPSRTESGYRQYGDDTRDRLAFIARSKAIGLSLAEIREILALSDHGACPCGHVERLLDRKLDAISNHMGQLVEMHRELSTLRASANTSERSTGRLCGIIEHSSLRSRPDAGSQPITSLSRKSA